MGKDGDLWDDSALTGALDRAMISYEVMHKMEHNAAGSKGEESGTDNHEVDASAVTTKLNGFQSMQENQVHPKACPVEVQLPSTQEKLESQYEDSEGLEYNQLLTRYFEVEILRNKLLNQLQQVYVLNHQPSIPNCSSGTSASGRGNDSMPTVPTKKKVNIGNSGSKEAVFKTEKEKEKAMKEHAGGSEIYGMPDTDEIYGMPDTNEIYGMPDTDGDSELHTMLSSWYAAGFYTARYLQLQPTRKGSS